MPLYTCGVWRSRRGDGGASEQLYESSLLGDSVYRRPHSRPYSNTEVVTYPVASDSEWRNIEVFRDDSLYISRVFLLLFFFPLYH